MKLENNLPLYKIVFHFHRSPDEVYSGKHYYVNKEKYASFCAWEPKLFKTEHQAKKTAERLIDQCINCAEDLDYYEIRKASDLDIERTR